MMFNLLSQLSNIRVEPTEFENKSEKSGTPKLERGQVPLHNELPAQWKFDLYQKLSSMSTGFKKI